MKLDEKIALMIRNLECQANGEEMTLSFTNGVTQVTRSILFSFDEVIALRNIVRASLLIHTEIKAMSRETK